MAFTFNNIQAKSYTRGRQGNRIEKFIVHWWGDPANNPTFDGTVAYFARGGSNTSAHYVVEAGRVTRMVDDADTAYQAGDWSMNLRSIGLECNPRASDADKATVAELIQQLRARHGNLPIIGHRDVVATACPGRYYPPNVTLAPWLNAQPIPTPTPTPTPTKMEKIMAMLRWGGRGAVWAGSLETGVYWHVKGGTEETDDYDRKLRQLPGVVDMGNVDVRTHDLLVMYCANARASLADAVSAAVVARTKA